MVFASLAIWSKFSVYWVVKKKPYCGRIWGKYDDHTLPYHTISHSLAPFYNLKEISNNNSLLSNINNQVVSKMNSFFVSHKALKNLLQCYKWIILIIFKQREEVSESFCFCCSSYIKILNLIKEKKKFCFKKSFILSLPFFK